MAFQAPEFRHGQIRRVGILLTNLGTPSAPTAAALRKYLAQFLSDRRVVEIPPWLWKPILHGIILRTRPAKSAAKYVTVWTEEGSPLLMWTRRQAAALQARLESNGHPVTVQAAMRYGEPSISAGMNSLLTAGADRILVLPLYPQYSGATTASTLDEVSRWMPTQRRLPELRFVNQYHDESEYIRALAHSVKKSWAQNGQGERLVMSYHGMPERTLHLGDPYFCQCQKTSRLLAQALELPPDRWLVTFQSRFGKAKWLEPATEPSLKQLAGQGIRSVDVICPGFSADCLETLEEIQQEGQAAFLSAGGKTFNYISCLNASDEGMSALTSLCIRHLSGWKTIESEPTESANQVSRARSMGAVNV